MSRFVPLLVLLPVSAAAVAADPPAAAAKEGSKEGAPEQPSDLTLWNLFTAGWSEEWVKRPRPDTAPNMALLRVTTNFLEREFRADYVYTRNVNGNAKVDSSQLLNALIAYGLNRRLMIELITNYQWNRAPSDSTSPDANGGSGAGLLRLQLVDTWLTSFDLQARVSAPNKGIGQTTTPIAIASGGFQDLQALLGLRRVGLYESIQFQNFSGPHKAGAKLNDLSYDISLARTWTPPKLYPVGNLTTFVEGLAATDLDGDTAGRTYFTVTPGVRFWFARENSLTFGVDLPVGGYRTSEETFRLTYIMNF